MDKKELYNKIDEMVYSAVFGENRDQALQELNKLLREIAEIKVTSTYRLYKEFAKKFLGFTVPAVNIRGMTYDVARTFFRVSKRLKVGALIFEIAKSEIGYTKQSPLEYAVVIMSASFKEGYEGPVFIQGDHFQLNRRAFFTDAEKEKENLKKLIREAVSAGFYNIDIDASTLVNLEEKDVKKQQKWNYEVTAELSEFIRKIEPKGITITIGGEIGEIGGHNSTPEELRAFLDGFKESFKTDAPGLSKISVQTGTTHGGVVLPNGKIASVKLDFNVLKTLSKIAREEYGLAGAVQHGASTLPEESFFLFPENECVEVHLATGFQNFIYDHPAFPKEFKQKIYEYLKTHFKNEWHDSMTEEQFIYKTRKKGFGVFKKEWWDLSPEIKETILSDMEELIEKIFKALNVQNTLGYVKQLYAQ